MRHRRVKLARLQGAVADAVQHRAEAILAAQVAQAINIIRVEGDDAVAHEAKGLARANTDDPAGEAVAEVVERVVPGDARDAGDEERELHGHFVTLSGITGLE